MCKKDFGEHVFVVGSSRSGTTLVHTILMSCQKFAVYRAETQILNGCDVKYGDLSKKRAREKFLSDWFRSRQYRRSGLTEKEFLEIFQKEQSPSYIWLLSEFMNLVASKQKRDRWIDSTPGNIFSLKEISKYFPNAKIVHVVRDGRAVSLSRARLGWSGVSAKNYDKGLGYSALSWEKSVNAAYDAKNELPGRFLEVRYEDLVESPEKVILELSKFLNIPNLEYNHINPHGADGKKQSPEEEYKNNSAFGDLGSGISSSAAYRWKDLMTKKQVERLDFFVGGSLKKYGYPVTNNGLYNIEFIYSNIVSRVLFELKSQIKRLSVVKRYIATPLELDLD